MTLSIQSWRFSAGRRQLDFSATIVTSTIRITAISSTPAHYPPLNQDDVEELVNYRLLELLELSPPSGE